jgi:glycosyltransferase involved in cell wall biosynthesis
MSVIICTRNRAELLRKVLDALCDQTLRIENFEVVVIDDGSIDDTRRMVEYFKPILPVCYAHQVSSGLAAGKNHGLALARGHIVVFLDDDDVPDSRLLEQHCLTHQEHPQEWYAVLGFTGLSAELKKSPLMRFVTEVGGYLFSYPSITHGDVLDFSFFRGGGTSCKRMFLMRHGMFNPAFRFGCEDIELGYRLSKCGLQVIYNSHAVSRMIRTLNFDDFCRRSYAQGRSNWIFCTMHPDPIVRSWAQVDGVVEEWRDLEPRYEQVLKMGRDLDHFATERVQADLPLDELTTKLLHRAYHAAFQASRIKGTVDEMEARNN